MKINHQKTYLAPLLLCLLFIAASARLAQAQSPTVYHITENNESLSTDIPGATITPTPTIAGTAGEQWTITLGGGYTFTRLLIDGFNIGEPDSPSGASINFFGSEPSWYTGTPNPPPYSASIGYWISDTANPSEFTLPQPDPVTVEALVDDSQGVAHTVILNDEVTVGTAPDGGATAALLAASVLALSCARRLRVGAA